MKNEQKSDYVINVVEMVHDSNRNCKPKSNNNKHNSNKMMNDYNRLHTLQMTEIILFFI